MSKIKNYTIKNPVIASDKWIGSDGNTGDTKNFSAELVASYVASTLTPEVGGVLKVTEIDIDTLVTDISTTVNALSPQYVVGRYEVVFFFIEGVVYVLKVVNITIGVGGTTLTNDDFITFPINTGENGLDADMTRVSTTSHTIASTGTLNWTYPSSLNLGWAVKENEKAINSQSEIIDNTEKMFKKERNKKNAWKLITAGVVGVSGYLLIAK